MTDDTPARRMRRPLGEARRARIRAGLAKALTDEPGVILILNDAPLELRLAAVRGLVVYSRDEVKRQEFVERTALQAMDSAFLRHESLRDVLSFR